MPRRYQLVQFFGTISLFLLARCGERKKEGSTESHPPAPLSPKTTSQWQTATHNGHSYVTLDSFRQFYQFQTIEKNEKHTVLESKTHVLRLPLQGTTAYFNNIRINLEFPLALQGNTHLIHRTSLAKTIDPVLRPNSISTSLTKFRTIVIDPAPMPREAEEDVTLQLAKAIQQHFTKEGIPCLLTCDEKNRFQEPKERLNILNNLDNGALISLRTVNLDREQKGFRTLVLTPQGAPSYGTRKRISDLAARLGNENDAVNIAFATSIHGAVVSRIGRSDRGIVRSRDPILAFAKHPAIILEIGNSSHHTEGIILKSKNYHRSLARTIALGVAKTELCFAHHE